MANDPSGADERATLLAYVAGRDVGCPACEYNLRDLRSDVCPECGVRLDMDTMLGADPGFAARRRRLIWAAAAVLLVGVPVALLVATLPRVKSPLMGVLPVGAFVSMVGSLVVGGWDTAVHADRIRYPRARNIASFAPVVHVWTAILALEVAIDVVAIGLALA